MENKEELITEEKFWELQEKYNLLLDNENYDDLERFAEDIAAIADKQGYVRGVEEALRVLPEGRLSKACQCGVMHNCGCAVIDFNNAISQAHDAISKLKEKV